MNIFACVRVGARTCVHYVCVRVCVLGGVEHSAGCERLLFLS